MLNEIGANELDRARLESGGEFIIEAHKERHAAVVGWQDERPINSSHRRSHP